MLTAPRFLVIPERGEGYRYVLQTTNSAVVLRGFVRPSRAEARADANAIREWVIPSDPTAPVGSVLDQTVLLLSESACGPYFAIKDGSGKVIGYSECYASEGGARSAVGMVQDIFVRERDGHWSVQVQDAERHQSADNWPEPPAQFDSPAPEPAPSTGCGPSGGGLERPRYFDRQQLRSEDLTLEQTYVSNRLRRLTRFLHGWGMVAGGIVVRDEERLRVSEGYGITPLGDEVYIPPDTVWENFLDCLRSRCLGGVIGGCPDEPGTEPGDGTSAPPSGGPASAWVVARPHQTNVGHAPTFPDDCDHPGNAVQVSRVCETFRLDIVCDLLPPHAPDPMTCEEVRALVCWEDGGTDGEGADVYPVVLPPPDVPESLNYVVLAELLLDGPEVVGISQSARRRLLPVEVLQRRLECLCTTPPPVTTPLPTTLPPTTALPTPTPTLGPTATIFPTLTPVPTATIFPTFTSIPTATVTLTLPPIFTDAVSPTFTIPLPTGLPGTFTGGPPFVDPILRGIATTERIGFVRQPRRSPPVTQPASTGTPLSALDVRFFDAERARDEPIAGLDFLDAPQLRALRGAGIKTVGAFLEASNDVLREALDGSDVAVAEMRVRATEAFRRERPIDLDPQTFDIGRGLAENVEVVNGIGPARANALRDEGIRSVAELAGADVDDVARVLRVSEDTAAGMVQDAQRRMRL